MNRKYENWKELPSLIIRNIQKVVLDKISIKLKSQSNKI
jgi:hypothetical protein